MIVLRHKRTATETFLIISYKSPKLFQSFLIIELLYVDYYADSIVHRRIFDYVNWMNFCLRLYSD